jgi:hypothetical protein
MLHKFSLCTCLLLGWGVFFVYAQEPSANDPNKAKTTNTPPSATAQKSDSTARDKTAILAPDDEYHTPRAGQKLHGYVPLLGLDFEVPERDRSNVTAVSLGAAIYTPKVGDNAVIPFAALYYTDSWAEHRSRIRMILAGVVNFIDFFEGSWNDAGIEFAASFENYTLPIPSSLEIEKKPLEDSEIYWGYVRAGLGLGWRTRITPWQVDNNVAFYFMYEPGVLYFRSTSNTADNYIVPKTTFEDRLHFRLRVDAMERNIMELRHDGWAGGFDGIYGYRHRWKDHDFNGSFKEDDTQTYYYVSGYLTWAGGPSFLSERHRFIVSLYGGATIGDDLDRYSAPRLGGGPGGDESEALSRSPIPGARFDEFVVSNFLLGGIEYRFELLFFMYLHIKGMIGPVRRMEFDANEHEVSLSKNEWVGSIGAALTTGFVWDSQLYIEYVHDRGLLHGEKRTDGHNVLISWSKAF